MPIETRNPPQRYAIIYLMLGKNYSWALINNQGISRSPTIETLLNFFPFFFSYKAKFPKPLFIPYFSSGDTGCPRNGL